MVKVSIKKSTTKGKKMTAIFFYNKERTKKKNSSFWVCWYGRFHQDRR